MSVANKLLQAAAGNASSAVYVDDVFSTFLYEGTGSSLAIDNGVDLDGEGGLIWSKRRDSTARTHILVDSVRGATKVLNSDGTYAEYTMSNMPSSFNSNGYTIGTSDAGVNNSGDSYVSWTFRKQEKFFDVVTYTGNGTAGRTISHNLNSVPGMIIIKRTDSSADWIVWHRAIRSSSPENFYVKLNSNAAEVFGAFFDGGSYSNVLPTSTQITLGDSTAVNASSGTYVMYLFAHNEQEFGEGSDEAIIHCGSYTGTGSDLSITLGFEPQWILFKKTNGSMDWVIRDNMRGTSDSFRSELYPNLSDAEYNHASGTVAFTSTGFRLPIQNGYYNTSGDTFIYMAIRRPHKPASEFAATDLFAVANATTNAPLFASSFPVDAGWYLISSNTKAMYMGSRLQGPKYLLTHSTAAEVTNNDHEWDFMDGWYNNSFADTNYVSYMLRRAKGFCDVVAYAGNGTGGMGSGDTQVISHNLGVAPEYIIVKRRSGASDWIHWTKDIGAANRLFGDAGALLTSSPGHYFGTSGPTPTATTFTVGDAYYTNSSGSNYIAYLFASVNGVSKVGTYTGTGSDLNVDCGFSAGVRFVFIKRTDSSGNWYVYDSVRGIVAGNDPYFLLNIGAVDVTNTDYIDPLNAGFTITSSAPADLNASGGTYIFLAIA